MKPSQNIDKQIGSYPDWRGELLAELRTIINNSDPNIQEDWKWNTAVWVHNGLVCAISAFKDHVKMNFFKGAQLSDPHQVINAGLDSKDHRSIDFSEGDKINKTAIQELVQAAISLNKT